jgi:TRAP-type C4-dicarboxylate transport system substrate-binding protein
LENYAFSVKNTLADPQVASKLPQEDKDAVGKAVEEALHWLDANQARTPRTRFILNAPCSVSFSSKNTFSSF